MKYSQGNASVGSISASRWENGKVLKCITQRALRNKTVYGQTLLDVISACGSSPELPSKDNEDALHCVHEQSPASSFMRDVDK